MLYDILDRQSLKPVNKGWSDDRKYLGTTNTGKPCLLRLSDISKFDAKKKEYEIIRKFAALGFPMSQPLDFGVTEDGKQVYMLLSWVEGEDLEEVLPALSPADQYRLGREAGTILKKIHSLPVRKADIPTKSRKEHKLRQLALYEASNLRIPGDEGAVRYVRENIDMIWREKPVFQHGDFHPGNLILQPDGTIGVIDFNRWDVGDPYEEFYKLESFGREISVPYCIGQIDAYFADTVPHDFWVTLAVYVAHASLYSIKWAEKFGQEEIDGMVRRCHAAMEDYAGFSSVIPCWYNQAPAQRELSANS